MPKKVALALIILLVIAVSLKLAVSGIDTKAKDDLFRQVQLFADTLTIVQNEYVDQTKPKDLIYGALGGMLSALDPHSQFMDPDTYNELKVDTEGKFGGLGIEITIKDGLLTVITPIEDTPAWKAGVKSGDKIIKINNDLTRDMPLTEAVKKMRGKPGEMVNLVILRESEKKILEFHINRDVIKIKDIKEARILEDDIAYIRLLEFRENTPQDMGIALEKLKRSGMGGLILDLRNNPGGLLDVAVKVTEKFVEKGKLVVYTKGRKASQDIKFFAKTAHPLLDIPMVVLINEGSASGSEIVAGCLKDYHRAIIVGIKSFGKGSVQTVIPLSDGSAIRLTTSKYFTPLGNEIHGKGVTPDIVVEVVTPDTLMAKGATQKEKTSVSDIFDELENKPKISKEAGVFEYKLDNQLMRAIDILKAIKFYSKMNKGK